MSVAKPIQDREAVQIKKIELRAYELWVHEGCPSGHDLDHWLQAEAEIAAEAATEAGEPATTKKK